MAQWPCCCLCPPTKHCPYWDGLIGSVELRHSGFIDCGEDECNCDFSVLNASFSLTNFGIIGIYNIFGDNYCATRCAWVYDHGASFWGCGPESTIFDTFVAFVGWQPIHSPGICSACINSEQSIHKIEVYRATRDADGDILCRCNDGTDATIASRPRFTLDPIVKWVDNLNIPFNQNDPTVDWQDVTDTGWFGSHTSSGECTGPCDSEGGFVWDPDNLSRELRILAP